MSLIDFAIFLEFSDENIVNPDAAVEMMERLANNLQSMSEVERRDLEGGFTAIASEYGEKEHFVRELGTHWGLS